MAKILCKTECRNKLFHFLAKQFRFLEMYHLKLKTTTCKHEAGEKTIIYFANPNWGQL